MADNLFITDAQTASMVQSGLLQRLIRDPLLPLFLFRKEFNRKPWPYPAQEAIMSRDGVPAPNMTELAPNTDPVPSNYGIEQWPARLGYYAGSTDTDKRFSDLAIVDIVLKDGRAMGKQAAQSLNRVARTALYNAAGYGQTRCTLKAGGNTLLTVPHINGFTHVFSAATRQWVPISAANPLNVYIWTGAVWAARVCTAAAPTIAGDLHGPGVLTITVAEATAAPHPIVAAPASFVVWAGGGHSVDDIAAGDLFTMQTIRDAVAHLEAMAVPRHEDGFFHGHLDPISKSHLYNDTEFQRLHRGRAFEDDEYRRFLIDAEVEGVKFYQNLEAPTTSNVPAAYGTGGDFFAGETTNATGVPLHRVLICGAECCDEYSKSEVSPSEAGITGKVGEWDVLNDGVKLDLENVRMILRAPLDRLQKVISTSWDFMGVPIINPDFISPILGPAYSEATFVPAVNTARYKRCVQIVHGATS